MAQLAAILAALGLLGIAAGHFLALGPLIALSVVGLAFLASLQDRLRRQPGGTSGGLGLLLFMVLTAVFLAPMWATAFIVRMAPSATGLSRVASWLFR